MVAFKFRNAGQVCVSPTRFYAQDNIYDAFVQGFIERVNKIKVGNGLDDGVTMGPLIAHRRLDIMDEFVNDAVSHGAKIETGGQRLTNRGYFFAPTVLSNVSDDARITLQMFMQDDASRKQAMSTRNEHVKAVLAERQKNFWAALPKEDQGIRDQIESIEIVEGHPAEVILRRARELQCDLIVLGAHDHGFSHTFLGTVAKRVLRRADIPTLVVPYKADT